MQNKIKKEEKYLKVYFNIFQNGDLTLHDVMVLSLLISYDLNNDKDITLTSNSIAKHFKYEIAKKTVDTIIPKLDKLGYITKSVKKYKYEDSGKYDNKRYIKITPKTYAIINGELPIEEIAQQTESTKVTKLSEATQSTEPVVTDDTQVHVLDNDVVNDTSNVTTAKEKLDFNSSTSTYKIPDVIITDEKLNWLKKTCNNKELTKELVTTLGQLKLKEFFYGSSGTWHINESSLENQYLIKYVHRGGSNFSLYNKNQSNDSLSLNLEDFNYTLKQRGIEFGQVTPKLYNMIKSNGLLKRPDSIKGVA